MPSHLYFQMISSIKRIKNMVETWVFLNSVLVFWVVGVGWNGGPKHSSSNRLFSPNQHPNSSLRTEFSNNAEALHYPSH